MKDMLDARKRGDLAFRDKDFKSAIDCYSQVGFPIPVIEMLFITLCTVDAAAVYQPKLYDTEG